MFCCKIVVRKINIEKKSVSRLILVCGNSAMEDNQIVNKFYDDKSLQKKCQNKIRSPSLTVLTLACLFTLLVWLIYKLMFLFCHLVVEQFDEVLKERQRFKHMTKDHCSVMSHMRHYKTRAKSQTFRWLLYFQ